MYIRNKRTMILLPALVLSSLVLSPMALIPNAQAQSLAELEYRCESDRERMIAPLRRDAVNQCVSDRVAGTRGQRNSRDHLQYCERFYADFGQGGHTAQGGFRQRMFHDIPSCQAYYEAWRSSSSRRR